MALALAVLGFFYRHSVNAAARWRAVVGVTAFLSGVVYVLLLWTLFTPRDYLVFALGFGLFCSIGWLLISMTVELQIRKTQPARLHRLIGILGRRATSAPCGLSILRGTLIGLALLGVDALAIWLGATYVGICLDSFLHIETTARVLNP